MIKEGQANWKVYIHTTPNGKKYIGITSQDPERRWRGGNGYYNHRYFFNAIKRYGWEKIKSEIVASGLSEQEAKAEEIRLIDKHDAANREKGYNLTLGGCGRKGQGLVTDEQKEKLSKSLRGYNSFLTEDDILDIKTRLLDGVSLAEIKREYGMTSAHLSRIINGLNWGYIMPSFTKQYKEKQARQERELSRRVVALYEQYKSIEKSATAAGIGYDKARTILIKCEIDFGAAKATETRTKVAQEYCGDASKAYLMKKYNITSQKFNNYTQGMTREKEKKKTDKQRKEMCELRKQGVLVKDIAKRYGCHREKVSKLTKG